MLSYRQLNYYYRCYHLLVLHWMLLIVGFYLSDHTLHQKYAYSIPENNCDTHMLTQVRILRNVCVYVRPYLKQVLWTTTAMKRNTTHVFTDIQSSLFCIVILHMSIFIIKFKTTNPATNDTWWLESAVYGNSWAASVQRCGTNIYEIEWRYSASSTILWSWTIDY